MPATPCKRGQPVPRKREMIVRHISHLPKKSSRWTDLRNLMDQLEEANTEEERISISRTIFEIVMPPKALTPVEVQLNGEVQARAKLTKYREKVGNTIRVTRLGKGMSQTALAMAAGLPQSHVSRLEAGRHAATHLTIQKLAKALEVRPTDLDPGFPDQEE